METVCVFALAGRIFWIARAVAASGPEVISPLSVSKILEIQ